MEAFKIVPTLHQSEFITASNRYACFSGGYGAGKTIAGCMRALLLSANMPGNRGLIGRLTYRELMDTTQKTFFELCPPEYYDPTKGGRWSASENSLRLVNGSEILFRHLDTMSESELKSLNLGFYYIDQMEEIGLPVWRVLQSRLRLNTVTRRYGFGTCNPEPGSWIEEMFYRPSVEGKLTPDYFYISAKTTDNPFNPPDYVASLLADYPEEMKKRYIEGRWDVMENQIYPEFNPDVHVVRGFTVPNSWERIVSLDHGMVNPTGILFGAIDFDYNVFIYDEYYSPGMVSEHAKAMRTKIGRQEISLFLIDPSTQSKTREKDGRAFSILEEYEDQGFYFVPANNEKLAGINRVKEFLKLNPNRLNPVTRTRPAPRLFIFQNCVNLIWEMKQYKWKKLRGMTTRNSPEEPVDYADHLCDSLYYMILSRFPAPLRKPLSTAMIAPKEKVNINLLADDSGQSDFQTEMGGIKTSATEVSKMKNDTNFNNLTSEDNQYDDAFGY